MPGDTTVSGTGGGPEPGASRPLVEPHPAETTSGRGSPLVWVIALGATAIFWSVAVVLVVRLLA
jgi:hypothetical protein